MKPKADVGLYYLNVTITWERQIQPIHTRLLYKSYDPSFAVALRTIVGEFHRTYGKSANDWVTVDGIFWIARGSHQYDIASIIF